MTSKPWFRILIVILVFIGLAGLLRWGKSGFHSMGNSVPRDAILKMDLTGIIMSGKKFITNLKKYTDDPNVKAVVIDIDSPGGAVGPSQDINLAIQKIRKDHKIPVVCYSTGLMASGAYYSAVACDKIVVASGALVGSIGVIMEFANLEKLYDFAKVSRYSITSGKFKDSGSESRAMREDEHQLFQDLITEVYGQFKAAVAEGRPGLKPETLDHYADGRVFTGAKAVELGFADAVGNEDEAIKIASDLAHLGEKPEIFEPPKYHRSLWDVIEGEEDPMSGISKLVGTAKQILHLEMLNRPLFLMPGSVGSTD